MNPAWRFTAEDVHGVGDRAVELIAGYLSGLAERPVFQPYPADLIEALATEPIPAIGAPLSTVLDEFADRVAPYPFGNGHPRFAAWVNSPPHVLGVFAEALAAAMNPSVAGGNHAATHIERQVVRWFAGVAGFPEDSAGLLVSGGSMATLTALTVARHRAAQRVGVDVRADGLAGRSWRLYLGTEGHGSARKAAELLGIGSANIRTIPSDGRHRLRPDLLREQLDRDVADGIVPIAVMASTGTVNTGAIDPLDEIADVWARHQVWLHVDGSYGGPAVLLLDEYATTRVAPGPRRQPGHGSAQVALRPGRRRTGAHPRPAADPGRVQPGAALPAHRRRPVRGWAGRSGSASTASTRPGRSGRSRSG
jgi:aromatic-L-amino-acid decarboxylase